MFPSWYNNNNNNNTEESLEASHRLRKEVEAQYLTLTFLFFVNCNLPRFAASGFHNPLGTPTIHGSGPLETPIPYHLGGLTLRTSGFQGIGLSLMLISIDLWDPLLVTAKHKLKVSIN